MKKKSWPATETSSMAIVSLIHVVVQRLLGCARSSDIDEGREPGGHHRQATSRTRDKSSLFAIVRAALVLPPATCSSLTFFGRCDAEHKIRINQPH